MSHDRLLLTGIAELLTMPREGRSEASPEEALGLIRGAAVAIEAGRITWVGAEGEAPRGWARRDLGGAVVLPGLVDSHTHLVWAGDRAPDFEARCRGVSYAELAAAGGGIRLTVAATRAADRDTLVALARPRLEALLAHGCSTVEIKSGYGLSLDAELKQLEAIALLAEAGPWRIVPTCLAAHIVPDEYAGRRDAYVALVTDELLPQVAARGLARFVDVFCDVGAFTLPETLRVLDAAARLGFGLKVHGEQLSATGVARAAAERGATSLDHLEHVDADGIEAMARAGAAAVLLPGASIFLGDATRPPTRALIEAGVPVAVATDCNPGSSPTTHIWLMATLACSWYGLEVHEGLRGITCAGARALGLTDGTGSVRPGGPADLAVCDVASWRHLLYGLGHAPVRETWIGGRRVYTRTP